MAKKTKSTKRKSWSNMSFDQLMGSGKRLAAHSIADAPQSDEQTRKLHETAKKMVEKIESLIERTKKKKQS